MVFVLQVVAQFRTLGKIAYIGLNPHRICLFTNLDTFFCYYLRWEQYTAGKSLNPKYNYLLWLTYLKDRYVVE